MDGQRGCPRGRAQRGAACAPPASCWGIGLSTAAPVARAAAVRSRSREPVQPGGQSAALVWSDWGQAGPHQQQVAVGCAAAVPDSGWAVRRAARRSPAASESQQKAEQQVLRTHGGRSMISGKLAVKAAGRAELLVQCPAQQCVPHCQAQVSAAGQRGAACGGVLWRQPRRQAPLQVQREARCVREVAKGSISAR